MYDRYNIRHDTCVLALFFTNPLLKPTKLTTIAHITKSEMLDLVIHKIQRHSRSKKHKLYTSYILINACKHRTRISLKLNNYVFTSFSCTKVNERIITHFTPNTKHSWQGSPPRHKLNTQYEHKMVICIQCTPDHKSYDKPSYLCKAYAMHFIPCSTTHAAYVLTYRSAKLTLYSSHHLQKCSTN